MRRMKPLAYEVYLGDCNDIMGTLFTHIDGLLGKEEERVHPTQKPVILIKKLIYKYKLEGLTIFDPFMGSGTTGVAALQCGCSFIGIEANEKYFQIAADRLRKEKGTPRLL